MATERARRLHVAIGRSLALAEPGDGVKAAATRRRGILDRQFRGRTSAGCCRVEPGLDGGNAGHGE